MQYTYPKKYVDGYIGMLEKCAQVTNPVFSRYRDRLAPPQDQRYFLVPAHSKTRDEAAIGMRALPAYEKRLDAANQNVKEREDAYNNAWFGTGWYRKRQLNKAIENRNQVLSQDPDIFRRHAARVDFRKQKLNEAQEAYDNASWYNKIQRWNHLRRNRNKMEKLQQEDPTMKMRNELATQMAEDAWGGGFTAQQVMEYRKKHPEAQFVQGSVKNTENPIQARQQAITTLPENPYEYMPKRQAPPPKPGPTPYTPSAQQQAARKAYSQSQTYTAPAWAATTPAWPGTEGPIPFPNTKNGPSAIPQTAQRK